MGREIRRVPLDFDWPLDKPWEGFLLPESLWLPDCPTCEGCETTPARRWAEAAITALLMLADDVREQALGRAMHPYFDDFPSQGWGTRPSQDIVALTAGLAGREPGSFGHDSSDRWKATAKVIEAAGLDVESWGMCETCHGRGHIEAYPGQAAEADAWEHDDPPVGDGWQLWQTVSEGSPISPVFATPEELARWMVTPGVSKWAMPTDYATALRFVRAGYAPSLVVMNGQVMDGVDFVGAEPVTT